MHTEGGGATPAFSGWLVYSSCEGVPLLQSPELRAPCPLCYVSFVFFFSCLFIIQFVSLFSLGGGQSVQGSLLICPRVVCGSTVCRLAHLVVCSPKQVRSWYLAAQEPSWFLHLMWSGDAISGLGVWRCQCFASFWWFFLQGVSPASLQDFTLGSMHPPSSHHLGTSPSLFFNGLFNKKYHWLWKY
jgi:hypothetical protein